MKKVVLTLCILLMTALSNQTFAGWDIRLGVSAGTNISLSGDVQFMYMDLFNLKGPAITAENLKFNSINPNIGIYHGMEFMLNRYWSVGYSLHLGYQQEGFSFDMKGTNFDAIGSVKMHGFSILPSFYVAYYPINRFSTNIGVGFFYEGAIGGTPETEMITGKTAQNDYEGDFSFCYAAGVQANLGFTYHINDNCFISLTGYYNAVKIVDSNKDMEQLFKDISNQNPGGGSNPGGGGSNPGGGGSNPGGGGLNPGGGGGLNPGGGGFPAPQKALGLNENVNMNYVSNGLWYQKDIPNRLTVLFTVGYRF